MTVFSDWLNAKIEKSGVGVNQLAVYAGLSSSAISKLKNGQRNPEPETVRKLAQYFKVDEDWLLSKAGHRSAGNVEKDLNKIQDPNLRVWLSVENINKLSPRTRRVIANLIKEEIEERREEDELEERTNRNQQ